MGWSQSKGGRLLPAWTKDMHRLFTCGVGHKRFVLIDGLTAQLAPFFRSGLLRA
jgi:hypothetical protein